MSWAASSWAASSRRLGICAVIGVCAAAAAWPGAATSEPAMSIDLPPELQEVLLDATWSFLKDTTDVAALKRFLPRVPAGTQLQQKVVERIRVLEQQQVPPPVAPAAEEGAWTIVNGTRDPELLRRFIAQFPGSPRRHDAELQLQKLATIIDVSPPPEPPSKYGNRDEAIAMVRRVKDKVRRDGPEATHQAINRGDFNKDDLYPFIIDFNGKEWANGQVEAVRGKNVIDLKDEYGKFLIIGLIAVAKEHPSGDWYDYRWPERVVEYDRAGKPVRTTFITADKSSYVERLGDDRLVGVGVYKKPNQTTVHLISGSPNSDDTYLQTAFDLADVLNNDDNVRVLPSLGIGGPVQNIRDVRHEKGIEIGLTQMGVLNNFRRVNDRTGMTKENKIVYITKLFNEEVHLIAGKEITSIEQLKGRKVNLGAEGSGTIFSMRDIFHILQIDVQEVRMSQAEAIEKVRSGEIAATALIAGKPVRSISGLTGASGLHFLAVPFSQPLGDDYLDASLTHDDYPELIPAGQEIKTVAASALLITYDWDKAKDKDRYQLVEKFINAFFPRIEEFKKPPHHPKWREVNLYASLPRDSGWTRFESAQKWLDRHPAANKSGD